MNSHTILPLNKRLDKNQINELLGYKANRHVSHLSHVNTYELLVKYHEALIAAEQELREYESEYYHLKHSNRKIDAEDED